MTDAALSAIQAVAFGLPAVYIQGYGDSSIPGAHKDLSLFVQDDWRLTDGLTLKAGLRYQRQGDPKLTFSPSGYPGAYPYPVDNDDLAPRLALAWNPGGAPTFSARASYGVFYDNTQASIGGVAKLIDGNRVQRLLVAQGGLALAAWAAPERRLPEAVVGPFPSLAITVAPGLRTPHAHHVNVGVSREIRPGLSISADAVFVRGIGQIAILDYNPLVPSLGPGRRPADVNGVAGTSATVQQYTGYADTWYRGLLLSARGRLGRAQVMASYTLSKAEDTADDYPSSVQDNGRGRNPNDLEGLPLGFDPASERGPSLQDERHRLVANATVTLPGEVQISSIVRANSGPPYAILAGFDWNGDGESTTDRPRRNPADPGSTIGRNAGRLPARVDFDMRASRRFALGSRLSLEALAEVFNLFNRTNFVAVNPFFGGGAYPSQPAPGFGQYTQAASPRQMQVAARLAF